MFSSQLEEREAQKQREWDAYGSALAQSIDTAARNLHGLHVPIEVTITTGAQWTDADLPGAPLDRLNQGTSS